MISYCHKLDVCLCVSLLLVYPRPGPSEWRTFGMADRYRFSCPIQDGVDNMAIESYNNTNTAQHITAYISTQD